MEENKYYVPEITEFHVGFEYEEKIGEWKKQVYKLDSLLNVLWDGEYEFYSIDPTFRVKYLSKEDIESLGWEFIKQHPGTTSFDFEKGDYSLNFDPEFGDKWNLRIYDGENQDSEFNYFSGYIKNKSELVKLLKQLGIETTSNNI